MIKALAVIIIFIGGAFLILNTGIVDVPAFFDTPATFLGEQESVAPFAEEITEEIEVIEKDIVAEVEEVIDSIVPDIPLRIEIKRPSSILTSDGTFSWTNTQRVINGAGLLSRSELLDGVAEFKMNDMFARQYFAHEAPTGEGVSNLAEDFGYEFILVGENLALGDFEDDKALLEAWMASPGHRENILNDKYREIGIAVGKESFDGRGT